MGFAFLSTAPPLHLLMLLIFHLWLQCIQTAINTNKNTRLATSHFVPLNASWQNWLIKVTLKHSVLPQPFHFSLYTKLNSGNVVVVVVAATIQLKMEI